ncbi:sigma-54-dependent Fis family transcriptional regulator [Chitinophaga agrisoli]|uniref:Sigma-54-dependent Fis family transcriptional regulator n=1 Tax=Chitinophaga agrisoli TaxID=2607653 RepID=A0A5B2VJ41_9BACT|nr:sigma-54 dependent transcriptional regulator [Chitinophaga agrisoli]KAA2239091.1 sigma-54-dependent Fis family transcriptional regulator [Chitinophaga agrisoli]
MTKKILIVEDEFIVANNLQMILEEAGYTINGIAASAREAQEHIQQCKPDLVLLDIRLKGKLSGIDIARKLRAGHIPFIYLSAYANQDILEEAKTTEPYGFLVKPVREKDLLVALEIAWYLHQHSLESKLRREEQLQKSITDIGNEALDARQSLLKLAEVMRCYIPFDFIACGIRPLDAKKFTDTGYLRTGFDEYQFIGEKELETISGLNQSAFSGIIERSDSDNNAGIYNHGITENTTNNLLQRKLMDCLRMESYLVFPVAIGYGLSVHYFFYSRHANSYSKDHIALLNRLKICLEELANKTIYAETSSIEHLRQPLPAEKKQDKAAGNQAFKGIIGNHHLLLSALDLVAQVAPYNTSVLILGESGTGKEGVAQAIHMLSPRKNGPFIKVNCAAIPATLIESELFGHEKGAFTGAAEKRKGKFELADGGTIFLDEIGELPPGMQVKLLRVLQEREIEYVGGSKTVKVNVRVVAATNRNLEKEIAAQNFRLDLYYRLNVFPLTLPPLRERETDIEALALFFAHRFCEALNKPFNGIADPMMKKLYGYHWPGNIRELENIIEQSVVLNDGRSQLQLMRSFSTVTPEPAGKTAVNTFEEVKHIQQQTEREYITAFLKKTKGRIRGAGGAAELLNIKPSTLESKMTKLNIKRQDFIDSSENL